MSVSPNLVRMINWDSHHSWPKSNEIPDIVTKMSALGLPSVIQRVDRRLHVDQDALYKYLEDKKLKTMIQYFKKMGIP